MFAHARRGLPLISKLVQTSVLTGPKVAPKTAFAARFLSQTVPKHSTTNKELVDTLSNEINEEKRLQAENKGPKPKIEGFEIKIKEAVVTLTKKHGNETIKIEFDISHTVDPDSEEFDDEEGGNGAISRPNLALEIIKGDKKLCFDMDIVDGDDGGVDYSVQEFFITKAGEEKTPEYVYRSSGGYIDPELGDLLFKRYLEERGITGEFLQQLVAYATHHEHQEYVRLLEGLKNFFEK